MTVDEMEFGLRQIAVRRKNALLFGEEVLLNKVADFIAALPANLAKPVPASGAVEAASGIGLRIAAKYAVGGPGIRLAKEIADAISAERAALASSTPAEADPASSPATMEGVREACDRVWKAAITALPEKAWAALNDLSPSELTTIFDKLACAALSPEAKERPNG